MRKGDEEALVLLYRSNERPITAFVTRNNGTADDAQDMLQEALTVLWDRVRSREFDYAAKLNTFIFATVKNLWLRQLARKRREVLHAVDPDETGDGEPSALDGLIETDQTDRIRHALNQLGEPCRTLLMLFYWDELPMAEIAAHLGFANADTVKSKKYQCKKALKLLLKDMES
jgi:RNA polymerase sigma factor (sigma-70 family)